MFFEEFKILEKTSVREACNNPCIAKYRSSLYNNRGIAKAAKGDYDGAIADYTKAIELNPNDAEAYFNRGLVKLDKGDLDGAIEDFNESGKLLLKRRN